MQHVEATVLELAHDWGRGAGVMLCETTDGKHFKAIGPVAGLASGQAVKLTGTWSTHPTFGKQLKVEALEVGAPKPGPGILKWLARTPGIGPHAARSILEHFADNPNPLDLIRDNPDQLEEVDGIGPAKAHAISRAVRKRGETDALWIALVDYSVPLAAISKVLRRFGSDAADVVQRAPYSLLKVSGIGFATADKIARGSGSVSPGSLARVRAGVVEVLTQGAKRDGHVYLPLSTLLKGEKGKVQGAARLLTLKAETIADRLPEIAAAGVIQLEDGAVYLGKHHRSESVIAGRLVRLAGIEVESATEKTGEDFARTWGLMPGEEPTGGLKLSRGQFDALLAAGGTHPVVVITGGPGVGKTVLAKAIVQMFQAADLDIELAAPTGRAAKRLSEATGHDARTIHRLLEYNPRGGFARDRHNPLNCDALVVDEFSMVDVSLGARLLDAVPLGCRVVIIGDVDQLPSVGPGTVLHDIIKSDSVPVVRLIDIFRQAQESRIIRTAHAFAKGHPIELPTSGEESDFHFFRKNDPEDIKAALRTFLLDAIPNRYGMDPLRDVMVLTPQNTGALGTKELNKYLQGLINPTGQPLGNRQIRVGDRVMQTRNNYDLGVFNGDVGKILSWNAREKTAHVDMGDRMVIYEKDSLGGLVPAYACTVHKAQGQGFPAVIGIIHGSHAWMLRRNLVYTLITRAEKLLVLIGQFGALEIASRNTRDMERYTRLAACLRQPPEDMPELDRAEMIEERLWTCDACQHTFTSDSPQIFTCPACSDPDQIRELKDDE